MCVGSFLTVYNPLFFGRKLRLNEFLYQTSEKKKLEFQLVLWASSSHILFARGHFLLDLVDGFVTGTGLDLCPLGYCFLRLVQQENLLVPDRWTGFHATFFFGRYDHEMIGILLNFVHRQVQKS